MRSVYGGGQVYVRDLVEGLRAAGHEVSVFAMTVGAVRSGRVGAAEVRDSRVEGAALREVSLMLRRSDSAGAVEMAGPVVEAVRGAIEHFAPEVVHANGWKEAVAKVCAERQVPCVVTAHHGGLVCPGGALLNADDEICTAEANFELCVRCCLRGQPLSLFWRAILGLMPKSMRIGLGRLLSRLPNIPFVSPALKVPLYVHNKLQAMHVLAESVQVVVAPSRAIRDALVRNGVAVEKTVVVHHGVKPMARREFAAGLGNRPVRFAFVGRINRVKGFHVLLEALRLLAAGDRCELHVMGQAHNKWEKRYLRRVLRRRPRAVPIVFHGQLSRGELEEALAGCDVLVLPSIYLEVFGLVIPEAFSLGRPVIVSRCGGPEELVRDGVDGLVVERNDARALAAAMRSLIDDPSRIEAMAANIGPVRTMEEHVRDLERVYQEAIDRVGGDRPEFPAPRRSAFQST